MTRRLNSSSQGDWRSPVRSPASTCATGTRQRKPAIAAAVAVAVFPWTTTQSYYPRSNACSICRLISPSLLPSPGCCITLVPALNVTGMSKGRAGPLPAPGADRSRTRPSSPALPPQRLADGSQLDNLRSRAECHEYAHGLSLSHRFAVMKSSGISWAVFDHTIGRLAKADSPR